jgi:predicted transcriptional regulator
MPQKKLKVQVEIDRVLKVRLDREVERTQTSRAEIMRQALVARLAWQDALEAASEGLPISRLLHHDELIRLLAEVRPPS